MKVVRWILWSPTRVVATLLVVAVLLGVLVEVVQYGTGMAKYRRDLASYEQAKEEEEALAASGGETPGMFSVPVTKRDTPSPDGSSEADDHAGDSHLAADESTTTEATLAADQFVDVFLAASTYEDAAVWVADLEPVVSPALLPYLEATDLAAVTELTSTDTSATEVGVYAGTFVYDLSDGTQLEVLVALSGEGDSWQVTDYGLVDTP